MRNPCTFPVRTRRVADEVVLGVTVRSRDGFPISPPVGNAARRGRAHVALCHLAHARRPARARTRAQRGLAAVRGGRRRSTPIDAAQYDGGKRRPDSPRCVSPVLSRSMELARLGTVYRAKRTPARAPHPGRGMMRTRRSPPRRAIWHADPCTRAAVGRPLPRASSSRKVSTP